MNVDLSLLERWLTGWSLARGLPVPRHHAGGLVVEVGSADHLRRHVFAEAGNALRECACQIHEPFVYLKAAVDSDELRAALPQRWEMGSPRYLMYRPVAMAGSVALPSGYAMNVRVEHGAYVVRFTDSSEQTAAVGRVVLNRGTAVFDRIETHVEHRRRGLGAALMFTLDNLAEKAGVTERLLVATEAGRDLYKSLGWMVLAPYSTAVFSAPTKLNLVQDA